jgi:hypothetical protein
MNTANADSIVERFVSALGDEIESHNSLAITISDFGTLKLTSAKRHAAGFNWMDSVPAESWYDFVLVDLPLAMGRIRINIGGSEIVIKRNWAELVKALRLLDRGGLCLALAEPMAFGGNEGERFEKALNSEGYFLSGIFNTPPGLLELTSIRPVLVVIGRSKREQVFVAELEGEAQAATVAHAFMSEIVGNSLGEGMPLTPLRFNGFANLKAEQQLSRLETQY